MSVSWVAGSTAEFISSGTSISATTPSGIANDDTLLAAVYSRRPTSGASTITGPAGWTKLIETDEFDQLAGGSIFQRLSLWSKNTVTSSDASTSFTWQQTDSGRMGLVYAVARGVDSIAHSATTTARVNSWQITPPTQTATKAGSMLVAFGTTINNNGLNVTPFTGALTPTVPESFTRFSGDALLQYRLCGAYLAVGNGDSNSGAFDFSPGVSTSTDNGLGAITVRLEPAGAAGIDGYMEATSPLIVGAIQSLGLVSDRFGFTAAASPLAAGAAVATHDFYEVLSDDPRHFYTMQLQTSAGAVRVPISSWQATLHVEDASFVQCVVPAADRWVDDLGDAESFVIFRKTTLLDGREIEAALASAPLQTLTFAQGGFNSTATLQGYLTDLALDPDAVATPTLHDVQTVFTYADGLRIRCAIDWQLRPGMTCYYGTTPIVVEYINYYVTQGQAYMDVGGA